MERWDVLGSQLDSYLQVFDELRSHHDGGDEKTMGVGGTDSKSWVELAQTIHVDVRHHVHRRRDPSVTVDPLQERLNGHVQHLVALEGSAPGVPHRRIAAVHGGSIVSSDRPVQK